ncbi:MAG: membrane protein insertion efficiency factor YidD [Rhodospirillales bacterium]|nr:membrane protein insertion efficiency factor YidD [Rhodospirillales bacterium]
MTQPVNTALVWIALLPVRIYRLALSPFLGNQCRFYPTCSAYMIEAVQKHGVLKGYLLGMARLGRCHPWHRGEPIDPVPERFALGHILGYKRPTHRNPARETDGKPHD